MKTGQKQKQSQAYFNFIHSLNSEHKQMLSHLYLMLNEGLLAIPGKYQKLTISLRTARAKEYH